MSEPGRKGSRGGARTAVGPAGMAGLGLAAVAGLALAAAIVTQGVAALGLGPVTPAEQVKQAAALLPKAKSDADYLAMETLARQALDGAPLEAKAVSLMAVARNRRGRAEEAERLIDAAAALSRRDNIVDLWLFGRAMEQARYDDALLRADALMRRDVDANRPVMAVIIAGADDGVPLVAPLAKRLAASPRWRDSFFEMALHDPVPTFIYPLFEAMQAAGSPPTATEMGAFLTELTKGGDYEQAYLAWLLSLSSDEMKNLGYLYDGTFEGRATIPPFGWTFEAGPGGAASISEAPDGAQALLVNSDGFTRAGFARQLVVLPPGDYSISGRINGVQNAAIGGLAWTITCKGTDAVLATIPATATGGLWRRFLARFTVPAGCPAQTVALTFGAGERRTDLEVWYDDLLIAQGQAQAQTAELAETRP